MTVTNPAKQTAPPIAETPPGTPLSVVVTTGLQWLARFTFSLMVVTLPWRLQLWQWQRPIPPIYTAFTNFQLTLPDLFLLITLLLWGICLWIQPKRLRVGPLFMWGPLLGLTVMAFVSTAAAVDRPLAFYHAVRLLMLLPLYLFVINEVKRPFYLAWAVGVQIFVQTGVGLWQWTQQTGMGMQTLGEHTLSLDSSSFVWAEGGLRALRAYGLTDHPNILAITLVISLFLLLTTLLTQPTLQSTGWLPVWGGGTAVLLLTFSRFAWLAFTAALVLVGWTLYHKKHTLLWHRFLLIVGVMVIGIMGVTPQANPYLRAGTDVTLIAARLNERNTIRTNSQLLTTTANELFSQYAITGTGVSTLPLAIQKAHPDFALDYQPTPNNLINVAAEIGLLGALFYGLLLFAPWLMLWLQRQKVTRSDQFPQMLGISAALLALTLLNFMDAYLWFYPAGRVLQWLVWGLWGAVYQSITTVRP